jgi:hypothetical protein
MRIDARALLMALLLALVPLFCDAQCTNITSTCSQGVPRFVKFGGAIKNAPGAPGIVAIRFIIYDESTHGTPLWQEEQNVQVDQQGRYEVMLGATGNEGIPMELFTAGEPRWLGVQPLLPGSDEEPRIRLVSVPYALEAADAQTLGGLPASAFAKASPSVAVVDAPRSYALPATATLPIVTRPAGIEGAASTPASGQSVTTPGGSVDTLAKFSSSASILNSQITDSNGVVSVENLSNILFADRFSGGVADAVNACPANGCIIYAISPNVNLNLGTIDPGTKAITIYLGPYTYTVKQITLRKALKIIGMGAMGGIKGTSPTCSQSVPCNGTALQSINGNSPVFVLPQASNMPATNVLLSGFRLYGSAGNASEDGFFLDTSSVVNSGLWYSTIKDIYLEGFAGNGIHVLGRSNDFASTSQWVRFDDVVVWRTAGGGNALKMEGAVFQIRFANCEFEGQRAGDGTNVYIGARPGGGTGYPTSIVFEGMVSQQAALAVQIDGAVNVTFYGSHHESLWAGYQVTDNRNVGTAGLVISDSYFAGNVGINGGKGYELSIETTQAFGVVFRNNQLFGSPDAIVKGTNFSTPVYQDNWYAGSLNAPPTSGITTQVAPAATINIQGAHSVGLNPSTTPITTIQSSLGPGEMVTFFTFAGPATFAAGGNIDLMGQGTLPVNGTVTFIMNDLTGGLQWKPVSQWSPQSPSPTK